jgi:inosose dehydratase
VHLKDVSASLAGRVRDGEVSLLRATQMGLFRPLGDGDAHLDEVVRLLDQAGYERWLVLEQDLAITGTEPPVDGGPARDVARSIEFLSTSAPRRERVSLP